MASPLCADSLGRDWLLVYAAQPYGSQYDCREAHAKRRLDCCFVDFIKAFDLVPRDSLWNVLKRCGMSGRVLTSLQSM